MIHRHRRALGLAPLSPSDSAGGIKTCLWRAYALFLVTLPLLATTARAAQPILNITLPDLPARHQFNLVSDNFIGISYELSSFDSLWGSTPKRLPPAMQNYLANIRARLTNPLRIRVGGNGMDGSTYDPSFKSVMLEHTDPDAYFNDIPVRFGPVLFDVLNTMADKVGEMQFMVGLSMRWPHRFDEAVALGKDAVEKLGGRLDAMLLGNEPDLYAGHGERDEYNISMYVPEIGEIIQQMGDAGIEPANRIGGPTICCSWDLEDVLDAGFDQYPFKYYTLQHYPQNNCKGPNAKNTNMTFFLSHTNVQDYINWNIQGVDEGKARGVPILLTEYNTVSCGGSNVSDTFAATLWALDAGLKAAATNFSAVYLHTREHGIQYNLFDPPDPENPQATVAWRTGSPYYAALVLAEATSQYGSVIIDLDLANSTTDHRATVAAYGIYDDGGRNQGKLALINYADATYGPFSKSKETDSSRTFRIPANVSGSFIEYRVLRTGLNTGSTAGAAERDDITWAGQSVKENGQLEGTQHTIRVDCVNGCVVEVPGPGAALVVLNPERADAFFRGNATIAAWPVISAASGMAVRIDAMVLASGLAAIACMVSWWL
ncbi:hypothetical protein HGRIS_000743 [Hohenbuehelia grisea]|uniref:Beta-glucuronidase C-terminal domain-containing protein n=1 Tax=Hohenbuehelia grisea TaxID=104357 RepID=A0ABR3IPK4_9AGAR